MQQNITIIAEQNYVNNKILFYYHSYVYYRVEYKKFDLGFYRVFLRLRFPQRKLTVKIKHWCENFLQENLNTSTCFMWNIVWLNECGQMFME